MTKYRSDVAEMAQRLGIVLPKVDEEDRLVRPVLPGDREDIAAEEREWKEEDVE